jgi:hypothetical protein
MTYLPNLSNPASKTAIRQSSCAHDRKRAPDAPRFNVGESPIARLHLRKDRHGKPLISLTQLEAASRLRSDFEHSLMQRRLTLDYAALLLQGTSHGQRSDNHLANISDSAIAARDRFFKALDVLGPELASIAYRVCCLAGGVEAAERALDLPPRSGKAILAIALAKLARHYGLERDASLVSDAKSQKSERH